MSIEPDPLFELPGEEAPAPPLAEVVALKRTATDVKLALRRRHPEHGGMWVCIEEAFSGIANGCGGIDLLAVGAWRSAKAPGLPGAGRRGGGWGGSPLVDHTCVTVGYEVKVSRGDFRRELYGYQPTNPRARSVPKWPGKAELAMRLVHYFMFAVPQGLLHPDEIDRREPWGAEAPRRGALYVPAGVGLVEVNDRGCTVRLDAELREPRQWTRHEIAELLRRVSGWKL